MDDWDDGYTYVYTGAPNECSYCSARGLIVKFDDRGDCPECRKRNAEDELWFGPPDRPFRFQGETG